MQTQKCPVCLDDLNENLILDEATHPYCFACWNCQTEWIVTKIHEKKATIQDEVPCYNICCSNKIKLANIYQGLSTEHQTKINEALFQVYLIKEKDILKCPNSNCSYAGVLPTQKCKASLECLACNTQWKDPQFVRFSNPLTNIFKGTKNEFFSDIWKGLFTKRCPSCQTSIQKNGGCSHMSCANCGYQFCWICYTEHPRHNFLVHSLKFFVIASLFGLAVYRSALALYKVPPIRFIARWTIIPAFNLRKRIAKKSWDFDKKVFNLLYPYSGKFLLFNIGLFSCFAAFGQRKQSMSRRITHFTMFATCALKIYCFGLFWPVLKLGLFEASLFLLGKGLKRLTSFVRNKRRRPELKFY